MHKFLASLTISLLALATTGCIVEAAPSRFQVVNDSGTTIALRQTGLKYPEAIEVEAHSKIEVTRRTAKDGCLVGWEIIDPKGKRLRSIDKICDGDTIVYP